MQFPDLPSTSGTDENTMQIPKVSDEIEDTLSLPQRKNRPQFHEQEVRSSATQVLKKDLFDENDEEVENIEEEESKGGSFFVKILNCDSNINVIGWTSLDCI